MALQYKHSEFSKKLATALSNGTCAECMLDKNAAMSMAINALKRYKVTEPIAQAFQISITRNFAGEVGFSISENGSDIGGVTSEGTENEILLKMIPEIISDVPNVFVEENSIYLYRYESEGSIGIIKSGFTPTTIPEILDLNLYDVTSIMKDILPNTNCLTQEELCNIIKYVKSF